MRLRQSGYKEYSNGSEYFYVYYEDDNRGYTRYIDQSTGKETHRVYHPYGRYDEWVYNSSTKELLSFSSDNFSFNADDPDNGVRNPASQGLNLGTPISSSGPSPDHRLRDWWEFDGIMGGLGNPWTATQASPASLVFGGYKDTWWWNQGPTIFKADLRSYYPVTGAFTTPDGGAYWGLMGGVFENPVDGRIYTVYIGPNLDVGIQKASFNGNSYGDMWDATGSLYAIQLGSNSGIQPADLMGNLVQSSNWWHGQAIFGWFLDNSDTSTGEITLWNRLRESVSISNQPFGVSRVLRGGTYVAGSGPYDNWRWVWESWEDNFRRVGKHIGSQWSNNRIAGKGVLGWVDLNRAVTGVGGSELMGTFDPNKHTWQAVDMWAWVHTDKFYDLIATQAGRDKLAALNIPAFEIGNASMMGSNGNLDVYNDMKVFAYASGGRPCIWTSTVSGNFTGGAPPIDSTVSLSGGGFSSDFVVKRWDNSKWGAAIDNGWGFFTRTDNSQSEEIMFKGGAAGNYTGTTSGTFQGYGSGRADRY